MKIMTIYERMRRVKREFEGLETQVAIVYDVPKLEVTPLDLEQTCGVG